MSQEIFRKLRQMLMEEQQEKAAAAEIASAKTREQEALAELEKALIEAGATRMRPIMMTSLTTILSMLPMAMAFGSSGSTTQGLAVVNIGGLTVGVAVALFILPVYYALMNGKKELKVLDI